ncbi:MAG: nuclear transport factor 2 family protein, partial [Sinomicrobium sp.]|nr:nuclear transport factor 2 family protein [Sinomicrobium sp.]
EIYLFELRAEHGTFTLDHPRNISDNPGYDNQPFFYNDTLVLFSSASQNQTDIAGYSIPNHTVSRLTDTPGSEYSPTKIPGKKELSAIRLDKDGKQLLYRYNLKNGSSKPIFEDLVIGYHTWFTKDIIVAFVLGESSSLVVSDLKKKTRYTVQKNIGRSLHRIPGTRLISYISKEHQTWEIRSLDPVSGATEKIINTLPEAEDLCWLGNGTILMGKGQDLYAYTPGKDSDWKRVKTFTDSAIYNITRLAVNSTDTLLALVAEASPEVALQRHLDACNKRDINTLMNVYADTVKVYNFPDALLYEGKEQLKKYYEALFRTAPDLHCELKNRIVTGNTIIAEEWRTTNGRTVHTVAVYEITNGKIAKVTFIQ